MNNLVKSTNIAIIGIIAFFICCGISYILGKASVKTPEPKVITKIEWKKSEPIHDTLRIPKPYKVIINTRDSVLIPSEVSEDQLNSIWKKYHSVKKYSLDFSNDSLGTFKVDASIYKNKLILASSIIQPNIRTIYETETIYKVPMIQFYGIVGSSTDINSIKVQVGVDLRQKYLIGVSYMRIESEVGYTIDFGMKF